MLEKIKNIIKKQEEEISFRIIRHVALTTHGIETYAKKHKISYENACGKSFDILKDIMKFQTEHNIPILTIDLIPEELKNKEEFSVFLDKFIEFFSFLNTEGEGIKHCK